MQIDVLRTFLTVARCGGFHAAARDMNMTQAAVSARIRILEETLNTKVFDRSSKKISLTEAGRHLLPYAEQITQTWRQVSTDLPILYANRTALRLGAQLSIWDQLLVDWMVWIETRLDKIPLTLNFDYDSDMHDAVRNRLVDIAITNTLPSDASLKSASFDSETLVLIANRPCRLGDPDAPMFADFDLGPEYRSQLNSVLPTLPRERIFLGNSGLGLRYIMTRGGMAFYPRRMIAEPLAAGTLHLVDDAPTISIPANVVYRADHPQIDLIERAIVGLQQLHSQ